MKLKKRAIIAIPLFLVLFSLCAYYQTNYEYHREYPSIKNIVSDYLKYIGETISISGEVVSAHNTTFQLLVRYDDKNTNFMVSSDAHVEIGDRVEVLGSLNPDYHVSAEKIIVYKKWKYYFIFIRSIIAILLLLFIFLRNWKFDFKRAEFIRRD